MLNVLAVLSFDARPTPANAATPIEFSGLPVDPAGMFAAYFLSASALRPAAYF
jgi:hypothetical protein